MNPQTNQQAQPQKVQVWIVDDGLSNHRLVERSLPKHEQIELSSYMNGESCLRELALYIADKELWAYLPDIVFMDFFLGDSQGDDITIAIREQFAKASLQGSLILGHSSVFRCSQRICQVGGNHALRKNASQTISPDIRQLFPSASAVIKFSGHANAPID